MYKAENISQNKYSEEIVQKFWTWRGAPEASRAKLGMLVIGDEPAAIFEEYFDTTSSKSN